MGYKAAIQVLKKAEILKLKVGRKCDLLNDMQAWTDQQQLQTIYHQVLVLDLEYALDKKVEQDLWTLGFKNHISDLQEQARDKKNQRRSESQALLSWSLEVASGFYISLLQELCSTYDLDLPFRRRGAFFGQLKTQNYIETGTLPQSSSCLYICQYCLVHLGDIARYRNQRKQAESFYKHAILVSPTSGHPYNQLALLEASQGDKLSTVFHYVRGIAVKNPFPGAATNLANILSAAIDKDDILMDIQTKMSTNEFIRIFLRVHALLHNDIDLHQVELGVKSINATLTALVATQSFTSEKLIKMTVINMFALKHTVGDNIMKIDELTEDQKGVRELILDLIAGSLSAFLLPVYTLKMDETLLEYYALPAIKLIFHWIKKEPEVLKEFVFTSRLQIWPGYCKLLNNLQVLLKEINFDKYENIPLPYDRDLQSFLPLSDSLKLYDFKSDNIDIDIEKQIRAKRLIDFGKWLTTYGADDCKLMICTENVDSKTMNFEPACIQPDPTDKLLEEMKSFKVSDCPEFKLKYPEKRSGILKPQGSLEKSREERGIKINDETATSSNVQHLSIKVDPNKLKRAKQNVALQSIYKKIEESKQVKFSAETNDKDKSPKMKPPIQRPQTNQPIGNNPPFRTQAFNQNHPALPIDKPNEYFNLNFGNQPTIDRNMPFPNNDILNLNKMQPNMQFTVPPPNMFNPPPNLPNMNHTNPPINPNIARSNSNMGNTNSNTIPNISHSTLNMQIPNTNMNMNTNFQNQFENPMVYNNMPPYSFNYNKEERPPNTNWWPNQIGQNSNYPQQDFLRYNNQSFAGNALNKPPSDGFNSPWNNTPQRNSAVGFGNANQGMSMRQAMLNETKHLGPPPGNGVGIGGNSNNMTNNTPGYSLFNPTSWTPTLPGKLRNSTNTSELRQQSLFTGPGPQSLQQLLDQQNLLQKGDT